MANINICNLSATELSELISKREISPVEIVNEHLSRIEEINDTVKAFIFLDDQQAMEAARRAEADINKGNAFERLLRYVYFRLGLQRLFYLIARLTGFGNGIIRYAVPSVDDLNQ